MRPKQQFTAHAVIALANGSVFPVAFYLVMSVGYGYFYRQEPAGPQA